MGSNGPLFFLRGEILPPFCSLAGSRVCSMVSAPLGLCSACLSEYSPSKIHWTTLGGKALLAFYNMLTLTGNFSHTRFIRFTKSWAKSPKGNVSGLQHFLFNKFLILGTSVTCPRVFAKHRSASGRHSVH